jgi:hypothetical protein
MLTTGRERERDMPLVNNSQVGQTGRTGRETKGMLEKGLYPRTKQKQNKKLS